MKPPNLNLQIVPFISQVLEFLILVFVQDTMEVQWSQTLHLNWILL